MTRGTGNPGMPTPYDQGRADAKKGRPYDNPYDQPGEEQEYRDYRKGYEQGKQQGVAEGWFSRSKAKPGVDDAGHELMKQDRQSHPDMDDYSWQIGWIYADGDIDVKAAYSDAYYDNGTIPSPPEPRSFKLGFDARRKQGVAEEQLEETSPEAIAKINQITRK